MAPGNSGLVLLVEDLTETQAPKTNWCTPERLASIGRLAAGVAHEIGNPITGIACLAQNLREEREGDGEIIELSSQIIEQTKRVSRIVQSLMSFAHAGGSHQNSEEPVCLAEVAQDAIGLLALNRRNFEVQFFNLCDPDHWAEGDPQRPAQVLINLLSNARDASPPGSAVRVRSAVCEHTVDLIVEDEGSGIPKTSWTGCSSPSSPPRTLAKALDWGLLWSIPSWKSIMGKSPSTARPISNANVVPGSA